MSGFSVSGKNAPVEAAGRPGRSGSNNRFLPPRIIPEYAQRQGKTPVRGPKQQRHFSEFVPKNTIQFLCNLLIINFLKKYLYFESTKPCFVASLKKSPSAATGRPADIRFGFPARQIGLTHGKNPALRGLRHPWQTRTPRVRQVCALAFF
ncbi:MAG: hypothetical protein U0U46_10560 [Saprospiraceae bacterium]|nr:hypothetical protein [Saprospiraceae bacterium]HNL38371.1 hypothetical protein [Saprospiraceae bacterium]